MLGCGDSSLVSLPVKMRIAVPFEAMPFEAMAFKEGDDLEGPPASLTP